MENERKIYDIKERTFEFSKSVILYVKDFKFNRIFHSLFDQLIRSATSIGANITEGKAGSSKNDFLKFYIIALKSANETEYWLKLIKETLVVEEHSDINSLLKETDEIIRILVAIILRSKNLEVKSQN
ncbi:four helix bundle protein [Sphingobacterium sp. lm-10]|uniref:four helix bundle protein n=1 Tax=Sphingobacterium sp. lm-10 TaxID=2944904 RepID=UPI0020210241|nr:four helix bundle protein [Sphingobacterium sp. lm-10]MCL7988046.1 four helix bundle protein [Sphingobacterium sp. lm-10]